MILPGIYPPIITPFKDDEVDYAGLAHNVGRWMGTGLRGLLALGSNGEAAFLDEDEAERIVATVREGVPRDRVLLVGTGRQSTRATIAATRRAATAGADAVLVLTPFYFKSQMTPEALAEHYRAVADASPVPVLLYNFTSVTGLNMAPDLVAGLSAHPNIVGLKDSNGDIGQVAGVVARVPPEFAVLVGSASTLHPAMVAGASGGIVAVANVVPEILREAVRPRAGRQARRGAGSSAPADAAGERGDRGVRHRRPQGGHGDRRIRRRRGAPAAAPGEARGARSAPAPAGGTDTQ